MQKDRKVFVDALKIGEELLDLQFRDYDDAYEFSNKYYLEHSAHFIDFFENHSNQEKGTFEYDTIRYFFIKAIEQRISSDLYANTPRGNVCDTFHSPFDIDMPRYPTNLPSHLENAVNANQDDAKILAGALCERMENDSSFLWGEQILNAVQFLGQTVGYHFSQINNTYKGYQCSDLLTPNEVNQWAGSNLCKWMKNNGYNIIQANFTRDTFQNVVATRENKLYFVLMAASVAPNDPGFYQIDLDNLFDTSKENQAIPLYASVSIGSTDSKHFADGIVLYGDQVRYRINAFDELHLEEQ